MTKTQRDYLQRRLQEIVYQKRQIPRIPDPPEIAIARGKVQAYDKEIGDSNASRLNRIQAAKVALEDSLYFANETDVVEALRNFEATQF